MCSILGHDGGMAGGMNRGGAWGPMAARVAQPAGSGRTTGPASSTGHASSAERRDPVARVKHCWVLGEAGRLPGLLLQWRQTAAGFQGRVVHPVDDPEEGWMVVEEWLPAARLQPVEPTRRG
jgi:hypothetical protein